MEQVSDQTETVGDEQEADREIPLGEGLIITSVSSYTGPFLEDGTDEMAKDILAITVRNDGEQTLQYADAELVFGEMTARFSFSTLRPGDSMVVLEKNRFAYPEQDKVSSAKVSNVVFFEEPLTLCEDKISLSFMDQAFNVKNISGEELSGNIAIYYKNKQDGMYYGGITYRVVIEGIEKDGIRQIMTEHFHLEDSEVMFVSYTEME